MASPSELTVATVLFGGEDVLAQTLPSWSSAIAEVACDVVIVDNSPSETPSAIVAEQLGVVDLVRRPSNPGFAASANEAIARAKTDWVLLINADVFLTGAALRECLDWIRSPGRDGTTECAAIGLNTRGVEHCGVELNSVGYFSDRPADSPRPPLGPSGGGMLISRSTFTRAGGFDDDLFAWGEDGGLSLRLFAAGVVTRPLRLGLIHTGGHSVPSIAGQRLKARLLARNRIRVMRRDWTRPLQATVGVAQLLLILANGLRKVPAGTARAHFSGVLTGLTEGSTKRQRPRFAFSTFVRYERSAARTASDG